ncbi:hypothetical protein LTR01_003179 [Friedmanniomyces endolithicus]|nr:hypothetical protein LTR01_003179 [Friedmanniomyces endolithicus]KAK0825900.1 hypothetical protein LTR73_006634 [Friedmanniomyces endolithicus]
MNVDVSTLHLSSSNIVFLTDVEARQDQCACPTDHIKDVGHDIREEAGGVTQYLGGTITTSNMAQDTLTYRTLVAFFTDFLTVAIHTILYERKIYPQTSFLSARKYNYAVRQSRHPKVCEWINDATVAVETELLKGTVERVAVVIYTKDLKPRERYVFDVSRFPAVSQADLDTLLEREGEDGEVLPAVPLVDIEEQFRATMGKLAGCGAALKPLPDGCTFTVAIELKSEGHAPVSHPQPWVPVQPDLSNTGSEKHARNVVHPVRAVAAGEMVFESWIEEATDAT